jgi:two-component system, NtrC family, nitrogen regulation sensor histidine kinase NtrY
MTLSLRARFILYLAVVHAAAALVGVLLIRQHAQRAWLLLLEILLVASFAAGVLIVRRLFRALAFVGDSAQFLDDGEYTTRFVEVGQPEVDRLIAVYNRMVDSLRAERQRVQEQHYFLSRILDVSPAGIVVLDFDGRIDLVNPAAARLVQADASALRGRAGRGSGLPLLDDVAALVPGTTKVLALPGGRRVRALSGTFIDRGFPRSFFLLEELTEELRRSEKAAYEKLIRMMSHEVNNSVGASRSLLESSLVYGRRLAPDDRAEFERALQIAIDRMGQLNAFMRSFADVVRLPPPARQPTDLRAVLEEIEGLTRAQRDERRIGWAWQMSDVPPVSVDRVQVAQALLNVVKNAMEAVDRDGTITVSLAADGVGEIGRGGEPRATVEGRVPARMTQPATRVRLVIEDTGPGIPDDAREQLFTPFFTTKPSGQGIGLTMVQEVLENHRAEYQLASAPGGPTRFTIVFQG